MRSNRSVRFIENRHINEYMFFCEVVVVVVVVVVVEKLFYFYYLVNISINIVIGISYELL
jgi:hypothetical protein